MNIVFAVSELEGLIKTGGLADVAKALPLALNKMEQDARVALPYYQHVAELLPPNEAERSFTFSVVAGQEFRVNVHQFQFATLTVYCFDIDGLFDREGIYNAGYKDYEDNGQRFTLFSSAILNFFQHFAGQLQFTPQIIHCNDWHTAVLPALFDNDNYWKNTDCSTLLSIHNGAYQGIFEKHAIPALMNKLGDDHPEYEKDVVNFLKLGIYHADKVVAVSPNYAQELLTELGSHHLFDIFIAQKDKVSGILNGCDYQDWSPETDTYIPQQYSQQTIERKLVNKLALQKQVGFEPDASTPLISMVCRLTDQKGLNYLLPAIRDLVKHKVHMCIAGTGDPVYVDQLEFYTRKYSDKFNFINTYSESIAHNYMAGADFFMMPSLFEPCGLTQMYSLAYGTLPIVREVGGLKDTVIDLSKPDATGIVFAEPNAKDLLAGIRKGLLFYHEYPDKFVSTQQHAMETKFLWQDSAKRYMELYEQTVNYN